MPSSTSSPRSTCKQLPHVPCTEKRRSSRKRRRTDKQRDFDDDCNDNSPNKEDGSPNKKKKAARQEQVKKVAKRPVLAEVTNAKSTHSKKRKYDDDDTVQAIDPRAKKTVKACIMNRSRARKWCDKVAANNITPAQREFLLERTGVIQHELLKAGASALDKGT
jgi:hypothetical protein